MLSVRQSTVQQSCLQYDHQEGKIATKVRCRMAKEILAALVCTRDVNLSRAFFTLTSLGDYSVHA